MVASSSAQAFSQRRQASAHSRFRPMHWVRPATMSSARQASAQAIQIYRYSKQAPMRSAGFYWSNVPRSFDWALSIEAMCWIKVLLLLIPHGPAGAGPSRRR